MLVKGIELMLVGMTVVFVFLALLVVLVKVTHSGLKVFSRYFPEQEEVVPTKIQGVMGKKDDIAVAIAAVKAFMKR